MQMNRFILRIACLAAALALGACACLLAIAIGTLADVEQETVEG